jgi:transcriptional regulator with XRE-family HTH domain
LPDPRARVGRQLRTLRRRHKLSQERLAERSGLSYKFIGEIERGTGNPTVLTLSRLAVALGVDMAELFGAMPGSLAREPVYTISEQHLDAVREALAAVETVIEQVAPPSPSHPRKQRR